MRWLHTGIMENPAPTAGAKARVFGSPGQSARTTGLIRTSWPLLLVVFLLGYLVRAAMPSPELTMSAVGVFCLLLGLAAAVTLSLSERRFRAYVKGARGEERVAYELASLPETYTVFHGMEAGAGTSGGAGDIDHVVVGPAGVFVIETKNWSGRVTVRGGEVLYDGHKPHRSPIEQVAAAGRAVERLLRERGQDDVTVRRVVCFAGSEPEADGPAAGEAEICGLGRLRALLAANDGEEALSEEKRETICSILAA